MAVAQLKKEYQDVNGTVPDNSVFAIRDEPEYAVETDLTDTEHALIDDTVRRFHADPSSFVTLDELKRRLGSVPASGLGGGS
jgi:hypothetical protein